MDKRFLTVWITTSIGSLLFSVVSKDTAFTAVDWVAIGLIAAIIDSILPPKYK